jgi:hypothetical protein
VQQLTLGKLIEYAEIISNFLNEQTKEPEVVFDFNILSLKGFNVYGEDCSDISLEYSTSEYSALVPISVFIKNLKKCVGNGKLTKDSKVWANGDSDKSYNKVTNLIYDLTENKAVIITRYINEEEN